MRPSLLDPLFASLKTLPGVGPKVEQLFAHLLGRDDAQPRLVDLLFHLPTGTIDRRARPKLADVVPGTVVTVAYNRTRWRDGRAVVWLSAQRGVGRGERSSGLGFDLLIEPPT